MRITTQIATISLMTLLASSVAAHEWRLTPGDHWQALNPPGPQNIVPIIAPVDVHSCPLGMVHVTGEARLDSAKLGTIEDLQSQTCTNWISTSPARCATFDREAWLKILVKLPTKHLDFCVDKFEYPNIAGENPIISMNWYDATKLCGQRGKRLLTEIEWNFACEGEEATPYPYGYTRDDTACNFDKTWRLVDEKALGYPVTSETYKNEIDKLWQGEPSGTRPKCVSPFGVYDMTGNVDELVDSSPGHKYKSALTGGYWGPIRARCRPKTRVHSEGFAFYQISTRCASDTKVNK